MQLPSGQANKSFLDVALKWEITPRSGIQDDTLPCVEGCVRMPCNAGSQHVEASVSNTSQHHFVEGRAMVDMTMPPHIQMLFFRSQNMVEEEHDIGKWCKDEEGRSDEALLLGSKARQALQVFYQNNDCSRRC